MKKETPVSRVNVIRAWKDEEYRNSLSAAERAALPDNPAGLLETTEAELDQAVGGFRLLHTLILCQSLLYCVQTAPMVCYE
jgi:mersacidin/lichenicidin family type 2 lantibiotic